MTRMMMMETHNAAVELIDSVFVGRDVPASAEQGHAKSYDPTNVLPDSRLSTVMTPKGAFMGSMGWMVPTFCGSCGSCGVRGPDVPQENMTFMFWLCDKRLNGCFEK